MASLLEGNCELTFPTLRYTEWKGWKTIHLGSHPRAQQRDQKIMERRKFHCLYICDPPKIYGYKACPRYSEEIEYWLETWAQNKLDILVQDTGPNR